MRARNLAAIVGVQRFLPALDDQFGDPGLRKVIECRPQRGHSCIPLPPTRYGMHVDDGRLHTFRVEVGEQLQHLHAPRSSLVTPVPTQLAWPKLTTEAFLELSHVRRHTDNSEYEVTGIHGLAHGLVDIRHLPDRYRSGAITTDCSHCLTLPVAGQYATEQQPRRLVGSAMVGGHHCGSVAALHPSRLARDSARHRASHDPAVYQERNDLVHPLHATILETVSATSPFSAVTIEAQMRPSGGQGGKVAPPTYPITGDRAHPYMIDTRWLDDDKRTTVLLDSAQSQANRCEVALRDAADDGLVELPMFELCTTVQAEAGPREVRLTSLDMPHRYADAYLRDAELDGTPFDKSEVGKALRLAEPRNARALYEREPYSLVYGAWDSHRPGRQAKFPRIYDSTIIGMDPEVGMRQGGRLDPFNLTGATKSNDDGWEFIPAGDKKKGSRLSEIGHGNAMDSGLAHGHVSITEARRMCQVHVSAVRGIRFGPDIDADAATAGRAALVALALLGDRLAFARASVFLRSSCDLARVSERLAFERPDGDDVEFELDVDGAVELFTDAVRAAATAGLDMASDTITLTPSSRTGLADAIAFAYTKAEGGKE